MGCIEIGKKQEKTFGDATCIVVEMQRGLVVAGDGRVVLLQNKVTILKQALTVEE